MALLRAVSRTPLSPSLFVFHDAELAQRARQENIATTVLGARGLLDLQSLRMLRRSLKECGAEIVHVHGYRASVYCALAVRPGAIAVVKTEHGGVEEPGLRSALYRGLEIRATRRMGAHVVFVTEDLRGRFGAAYSDAHQSVIYNGIEPLSRADTQRPAEYASQLNFAIVGRLERVKGIDYAIRALALPAMPPSVQIQVIGDGPLRSELEQLAAQLRVRHRVHFTGFRRNVYDYIAHADALLMPSLHEGLPYTLLEAMSLGTPILASRVGGLKEILVHESTGLHFNPSDETAIAEAARRFVSDPELGKNLVARARGEVAARFSASHMAERYVELYRTCATRTL